MVGFSQILIYKTKMIDCVKAKVLVDWIYWTQTNPLAERTTFR